MSAEQRTATPAAVILGAVLIGAAAAVVLGAYGAVHEPRFFSVNVAGFSSPTAVKSWLATLAAVLALFQLGSAAAMYGRIPGFSAPGWFGAAHAWSGRLAVLAATPVAVHCLYALGFQHGEPRALAHSVLGCFFYGAFVAKMLLLTRKGLPGWVIPVAGGVLFAGLAGVWLTSALWFFQNNGLVF